MTGTKKTLSFIAYLICALGILVMSSSCDQVNDDLSKVNGIVLTKDLSVVAQNLNISSLTFNQKLSSTLILCETWAFNELSTNSKGEFQVPINQNQEEKKAQSNSRGPQSCVEICLIENADNLENYFCEESAYFCHPNLNKNNIKIESFSTMMGLDIQTPTYGEEEGFYLSTFWFLGWHDFEQKNAVVRFEEENNLLLPALERYHFSYPTTLSSQENNFSKKILTLNDIIDFSNQNARALLRNRHLSDEINELKIELKQLEKTSRSLSENEQERNTLYFALNSQIKTQLENEVRRINGKEVLLLKIYERKSEELLDLLGYQ